MSQHQFYAHSTDRVDKANWQSLPDHLTAVAELAAQFGMKHGIEQAAYIAGLFHDLGKYHPDFQRRLEGENVQVDHSTAGAAILRGLTSGHDRSMADLVAYSIAGHHAGLPDKTGEGASTLTERLNAFEDVLDPAWRDQIKMPKAGLAPEKHWHKSHAGFQFAFLGRMIFSCLVDADYKDTEAFYVRTGAVKADREWPSLQSCLPAFLAGFEAEISRLAGDGRPINKLRGNILSHVRAAAARTPGLYTLTVPTGGGKTLASLGFALDHARAHGHSRIIYAIPFTSIIDQTATKFRDILGHDAVLEHHSAIDEEVFDPRVRRDSRDKLKLAMEDWGAPVVVTTNVQLFESLFAARPSKARKLHNIANSIIILDEAQTLPHGLLAPCVRALDELALNYGCTIILCTATQPALEQTNFGPGFHWAGLDLKGQELAPDPAGLARQLKRITIERTGDMSNEDLVAAQAETEQALVVVNSRKHALALYQVFKAHGLDGILHLSTRQYAAHRRTILADIRQRLRNGEPCRVIATSLIEAGVDVDFPRVWRAEAGLDQIAQAAGRCNREGRRTAEDSRVIVFSAPDFPPPPEIMGLIGDAKRLSSAHDADLLSPASIAAYFGEVYWRMGPKRLDKHNVAGRFRIDSKGTDFDYRSFSEDFRMIESGMVPVIVPGDDLALEAIGDLGNPNAPSGGLARRLQLYTVQVPPRARNLLIDAGLVRFAHPDLRADQFAVLQDQRLYQPEVGLLWEDPSYLSAEALVI